MVGKILVLGATGTVGTSLVKALLAMGEQVKAASRSAKPVEGAESVRFDYDDASTFGPALEGVDRVYVMLATGYVDALGKLMPIVTEVLKRKIKVVFQSVLGVDADDSIPYRQVELAIINSGVPSVILRPNWFSDNFHTFWKQGIDHGQIAVPAGDGQSSFIDTRDIAESAAAALTTDAFDGKAFNLTGPETLGYAAAADLISKAIGKPVTYNALSDEGFVSMLTGAGVPQDYAQFLASIFYPVRQGWTAAVTGDVETLTGKAPRTLDVYIHDNLSALQG